MYKRQVIGESDYLCDFKLKLITEFMEELLGGKGICTVDVYKRQDLLSYIFIGIPYDGASANLIFLGIIVL